MQVLGKSIRSAQARRWNHARGWMYVGRAKDGEALDQWPVNLWSERWIKVGNEVTLRHPGHAQPILVQCYFIIHSGRRHPFASLKMSDETCVFFVPVE